MVLQGKLWLRSRVLACRRGSGNTLLTSINCIPDVIDMEKQNPSTATVLVRTRDGMKAKIERHLWLELSVGYVNSGMCRVLKKSKV